MPTLTISIIILLVCNYISSGNVILTQPLIVASSSNLNECTVASQCPISDACIICDEGLGPSCEQPTCINGECSVIERCSQEILSTTITTPSNNQCIGTDTNHCIIDLLCELCQPGYSPVCSEPVCINNQCETIPPCSIYTPTKSSIPITPIAPRIPAIPMTPIASRIPAIPITLVTAKPPVILITPVTAKPPVILITPIPARSPAIPMTPIAPRIPAIPITPVTAKPPVILITPIPARPPAIPITPLTSTKSSTTTDECEDDNQCPHSELCKVTCANGTTPLCASAICVDGKCINIAPCSQFICKTRATCPYKKRNCMMCPEGYGPECEQPACSCGLCSTVPPCSEKQNIIVGPIITENK